jgi:hypothetical protein
VFAAIKVAAACALACGSIIAAIAESRHPLLFGCLCVAFTAGAAAAEVFRAHRNSSVRSILS